MKAKKITGPQNFQHNTSIKLDANGCINMEELPTEFQEVFKKAGIRKKDLKNPEMV